MPAIRQRQTHHHIARRAETDIDRLIRRRTRIRLHIDVLGTEDSLGAFDSQLFNLVDLLLAFVIALAGITFGIFVGQNRTGGFEHRLAGVVFGRNQTNLIVLALIFGTDNRFDFRIELG